LICDTGVIVAAFDRDDDDHAACASLLAGLRERRVVPAPVATLRPRRVEALNSCHNQPSASMNAMSRPANGNRSERQRRAAIRYAEGSIAHLAPGVSLADELIADRRRGEARTNEHARPGANAGR
jgi:hypothetical protein